ncbi:Hypothetical predicted protein [Mytilus galloprovincialis]|uniref:Protein kinase domain-containing protein n=1 Tax=Mytilus galloprovincialis TaxID=29158 RepID=A0A8B6GI06_MYTGA|nr:Hypothetical predicted protein [Mytilus galloprovincialis]
MAQGLWNEVMILNANPHPHLIRCYGLMKSLTDQNISYLLLEYMEMLKIKIGIVYFKGDNILKDIKGFYKIADFGLSKRGNIGSASGIYSLMTAGVGTLSHMAPEVKTPASNVLYDTNADIWSLGCLVLEILSRGALTVDVNNHQALPVYTLPPGISPQCTHFMQCCLQVNPANRHTSSMLLKHDWFKM